MKRHSLATRLWHWINVLALVMLFMSGLNISNAHRHLYWGKWGFGGDGAWLDVMRFPGWATIPDYYSLAVARQWHLLFAWVFALGLLFYMIASLINRHFRRDIATRRSEWRWNAIRSDIAAHLRFDFAHRDGKYNFLQKVAYGLVLFVLLPAMILTGMAISPGTNASLPFLVDLFGGRQGARSVHFIAAWGLFGFFVLHVALVLASHPLRQMRAMITGGRFDEAA
ncbi:cytochrome b/b6 domain-containing protein [Tsuneonella sp. HG222]